ncbi:MAG: Uma2 family endonuclease [Thermomicrobiales bacterium]
MALAVRSAATTEDVRPLTYDDLLATPEDGKRYEIVGGELYVAASPDLKHQDASGELYERFRAFVRPRRLGRVFHAPTDVKLTEYDTVVPDVIFVSRERAHIMRPGMIEGAPDLLVEVISPSTRRRDRVHKAALYASAGVREYWIVDPTVETILIQRLQGGRYVPIETIGGILHSTVLVGFELDVARFFASLPQ